LRVRKALLVFGITAVWLGHTPSFGQDLLNPDSRASKLVLAGRLNEAKQVLEAQYSNETDRIKKKWIALESYLIPAFKSDILSMVSDFKRTEKRLNAGAELPLNDPNLYINADLIIVHGATIHVYSVDKKLINDSYLRYERDTHQGSDESGIAALKALLKARMAFSVGDMPFAFELISRARYFIYNNDIRKPLVQLAYFQYIQALAFYFNDQRELRSILDQGLATGILDVTNPVLAPHIKSEVLSILYDSGLLSRPQRLEFIERLKNIEKIIPEDERNRTRELVEQKEATELLLAFISGKEHIQYGKTLTWLTTPNYNPASFMAQGVKVFYETLNSRQPDTRGILESIEKVDKWLKLASPSHSLFGIMSAISKVLRSVLAQARGRVDEERSLLFEYVRSLMKSRDLLARWPGFGVSQDDAVTKAAHLYVAKRLSVLAPTSAEMADLLHTMISENNLRVNLTEVETFALYSTTSNENSRELLTEFLNLKAAHNQFLNDLIGDFFTKPRERTLESVDREQHRILTIGLRDLVRKIPGTDKRYSYYTKISELSARLSRERAYYWFADLGDLGIAISLLDGKFSSRIFSQDEIIELRETHSKLSNREISREARIKIIDRYFDEIFNSIGYADKAITLLSGTTILGVPSTLIRFQDRWHIDTRAIETFMSTSHFIFKERNSGGSSQGVDKRLKPEYAFLGVGNPKLRSKYEIASVDATELLIRGSSSASAQVLSELPETEDELRTFYRAADGPGIIAVGESATKPALLSTDLSRVEVLSIATHGVLSAEAGTNSPALILTETDSANGLLSLKDIASLVGAPRLVILSACNTATKDPYSRELLASSLGTAFLTKGSDAVISSYWHVNSQATKLLMEQFAVSFFGKESTNSTVAFVDALRKTKQSFPDPIDWGGFVPMGSYSREPSKRVEQLTINRPYIYDFNYDSDDRLSIISAQSVDKTPRFSFNFESFRISDSTISSAATFTIDGEAPDTARLIKDESSLYVVAISRGKSRVSVFSLDSGAPKLLCSSVVHELGNLVSADIRGGLVYITSVRPQTTEVTQLSLVNCHALISSKAIPKGETLIGASVHFLDDESGKFLVLTSFQRNSDKIGYFNTNNSLNEKLECSYVFRVDLEVFQAGVANPAFGKSLNGLHHMERSAKHLDDKSNDIYLRHSPTCVPRVYLVRAKTRELIDFVETSDSRHRAPLGNFLSLEKSKDDLEAGINNSIHAWSSLSMLPTKLGSKHRGTIFASRAATHSRFFRTRSPSKLEPGEISVADIRAESAFYTIDQSGLSSRIQSGVECQGYFNHAAGIHSSAIGCLSGISNKLFPNRVILIQHSRAGLTR